MPPAQIVDALRVDPVTGLSTAEHLRRLAEDGPNSLPSPPVRGALARFFAQLSSPIVLTLVAGVVIATFVGARASEGGVLARYGDAIAIAFVVLLNACLGFFQERKAASTLAALRSLQTPNARVSRDGVMSSVPAETLVAGDVVELAAGDAVPADVRLMESASLRADESALTGESEAVTKEAKASVLVEAAVAERPTMLFMGTLVVNGTGRALVVATGAGTELGKIGALIGAIRDETTPLERDLGRFSARILWTCLAMTLLLFGWGLVHGGRLWAGLLLEAVSFAVAIIPEGLPAVTTITLAIGVQRMAKRGAVVRHLAAVETLGRATVICTDKTGTLTRNEMTVREVWMLGAEGRVSGEGYGGEGALDGIAAASKPRLHDLVETAVVCNDASLEERQGVVRPQGDPTEAALLVLARKAGFEDAAMRRAAPRISALPFDSTRKRMSVLAGTAASALLHVKGSVETVLEVSTRLATAQGEQELDSDTRHTIETAAGHLADRGLRVLAFARRAARPGDSSLEERELTLLGLVGMLDPPREGVPEAVRGCADAGIRTVMITGDHKATATAIARDIGLFHAGDEALTGTELAALSDEQLAERLPRVRVFARVAPEQKLRIVRAFKRAGEIVAMTGDGVNDAPALREAHIGVAMGRSGTAVARQAADIVLTDDNFATLVDAVREGRAIYRNIQKFVFFLLSSNAGLALAVFAVALTGAWMPLTPLMILWINLVTNGAPALALGVDPAAGDLMKSPPRRATEPLVGARDMLGIALVGVAIAAAALVAYSEALCPVGGSAETHRTIAFFVLAIAPLLHAWSCRSPTASIIALRPTVSIPLLVATALSLALQALALLPGLRDVFHVTSLDGHHLALAGACSVTVIVIVEVAKLIDRRRSGAGAGAAPAAEARV